MNEGTKSIKMSSPLHINLKVQEASGSSATPNTTRGISFLSKNTPVDYPGPFISNIPTIKTFWNTIFLLFTKNTTLFALFHNIWMQFPGLIVWRGDPFYSQLTLNPAFATLAAHPPLWECITSGHFKIKPYFCSELQKMIFDHQIPKIN